MNFEKTPLKIKEIIELFHQNKIEFILFKCEHILSGKNKNLDLLFKTKEGYDKASILLENNGFVLYLSEKVEKYKKMYVKFSTEEYTRIHLHREISWHGLIVIDKKDIFYNCKKIDPYFVLPSNEDQLIIHAAHCIFENLIFKDYQMERIRELLGKKLNKNYINERLNHYGWKKEFHHVVNCVNKNKQPKKSKLILKFITHSIKKPNSWTPILLKLKNIIFRKINLRRKGCLISLIGVNGSGKTTLANEVLKAYRPLTDSVSGQKGYYFGWVPFTPWAKFLSNKLKKNYVKLFREINETKKIKRNIIKDEIFFICNYIEYLIRYLFVIYPQLRKNKLVVTDRYFYDLYGQYNNSEKSSFLPKLLLYFPKPDYTFVLDAPLDSIIKRDKNTKVMHKDVKKDKIRTVHDRDYLLKQKRRYDFILKKIKANLIDTNEKLIINKRKIIKFSWKTISK